MSRRVSIVSACLVALVFPVLAGGGLAVHASAPHAGTVTVSWWSHNNPAFVAANKVMIARFEKANPNIKITYQNFPYDVFVRKLQAAYRAHNASDMQQMFGTWVTPYAQKGNLDPVPSSFASTMGSRFYAAPLGAYHVNGKYYGIPKEYNLENGGMLVNWKLLRAAGIKAAPTTWTQLVADGKKLSKRNSRGKLSQFGFSFTNGDSVTFLFLQMILQQGASYWSKDGKHLDFSTPAAKRAWMDETALVTKYHTDDTTSYAPTLDTFDLFFQGREAMGMRGPWVIAEARTSYPKAVKSMNYCYCPMPTYRGSTPYFAAESGWGEVVNASSSPAVKAAAWKFAEFMARSDNLRYWALKTATVPAIKSLTNDPAMLRAAPYLKTSFKVLPYGRWVGPVQDRDYMWTHIHDALVSVELHRQAPLAALTQAQSQINTMISQHLGP